MHNCQLAPQIFDSLFDKQFFFDIDIDNLCGLPPKIQKTYPAVTKKKAISSQHWVMHTCWSGRVYINKSRGFSIVSPMLDHYGFMLGGYHKQQ
jgi:hypothetical protein